VGDIAVEVVPEPRLLETAFALEEGAMSDVVETEHGVYVLRVIRREPPHMPPFEAVGDAVRGRLARDRAREAAKAAAEALRTQLTDRLAQGDTAHAAAQALGVGFLEPEPFTRTEAIPPLGYAPEQLNQVVFDTPIGGVTEALETPVGFALFIPKERLPVDESTFPEHVDPLREQLLLQKRRARLAGWLAELREEAHLQSFVEAAEETSR
jgi:peptidyl-prolyl cis-trans isomerase D